MSYDLLLPLDTSTLKSLEGAITSHLRTIPPKSPQRHAYHLALALSLSQQGEGLHAIEYFQHIPQSSQLFPTARFFYARNRLELAKNYFSKAQFDKARSQVTQALETLSKLSLEAAEPFHAELKPLIEDAMMWQFEIDLAEGLHEKVCPKLMALSAEMPRLVEALARCARLQKDVASLQSLIQKNPSLLNDPDVAKLAGTPHISSVTTPKRLPAPPPADQHPAQHLFIKAKNDFMDLNHIVKRYPKSEGAMKAGARMDVLMRSYAKKGLPAHLKSQLEKIHPNYLYKFGQELWNAERSKDAQVVYRAFYETYPFDERAVNALYFTGRLHEDQLQWRRAREVYERVAVMYPNTPYGERSAFKVGFMSYLAKDYSKARLWFESHKHNLSSAYAKAEILYWLGNTYEKLGLASKAQAARDEIALIAPLSYYTALLEKLPSIKKSDPPNLPELSAYEKALIERTLLFLQSGLPQYAQKTLRHIPFGPSLAHQHLQLQLHHDSKVFTASFGLAAEQLQRSTPPWDASLVRLFFPLEFHSEIKTQSQSRGLDPYFVQSLIKQESAFQPGAKSRVGAMGLMQLMPATALAVSKTLGQPLKDPQEALVPATNLMLGTKYISDLLKDCNQSPARALASYNAGPRRVSVWTKRWSSLNTLEWIEMIPLDETRNYVKTIFRNYAYYSKLGGQSADLSQLLK